MRRISEGLGEIIDYRATQMLSLSINILQLSYRIDESPRELGIIPICHKVVILKS